MKSTAMVSERNFLLRIEPRDKLTFIGDITGEIHATIKLTNNSDSRQAFKVKCTRNDLFRIRPAIGILDYGETICIDITYKYINNQIPESNRHHFGVYHIPAPEGATCAGAWAEHYGPPQGEFRMKHAFFIQLRLLQQRSQHLFSLLAGCFSRQGGAVVEGWGIGIDWWEEMNEETLKEEDWRYKYRSAFTYAAYNDLDKMGCEAPKRCPIQVGPRYCQYSYSVIETEAVEEAPLAIHTAAVESIFVVLAFLLFLMTLPFSLIFSLKFVGDFERLVVLRLGRAQKIRGPGATVVLPCIDTYTKVDLRVNAFNVPPMQIITFDRGLVELGATIFSQVKINRLLIVKDALAAVCAVQERNQSTRVLSVATLRRLVCKRRVSDVISSLGRRELCENLQVLEDLKTCSVSHGVITVRLHENKFVFKAEVELGILTTAWGVEITKVELSEVKVIKEGENMALSTFNKVLKSEVGSQIIEKIKGAAQKFIVQQQQKQQSDHQQQIEKYTKKDITNLSGEKLSEKNKLKCVLNNSLKNLDIDRLLCSLTMVIDKQLVVSVGHIFQVNCTGFGDFYVDLKNDSGNCCKGTNPTADVTFRLSHELLIKILKKEVAPMQAYLDGSLQIMGSLKAAIRLTLLSDRFSCLL
ncbi:unnamed protein product [Acanthocheilonema viteae]|uniref:MSP domain-containing protein n=1 Tax=Acanthocheilonema viteae TaxID=6277 RepID=A0A498SD19_ACAVI|nr:unnamed protein product [Acanthocheilonema viteae]